MSRLCDQEQYVLARSLSRETLPAASALLLGNRELVDNDVKSNFVKSGTMHLLAISGLLVGILAGFVLPCVPVFRSGLHPDRCGRCDYVRRVDRRTPAGHPRHHACHYGGRRARRLPLN